MQDQMTYPVIAWTLAHNGAPLYVSQLPGDGGVDWGFTNKAGGTAVGDKVLDKALPLSKAQWQRFAARQRAMRHPCLCCPAPVARLV